MKKSSSKSNLRKNTSNSSMKRNESLTAMTSSENHDIQKNKNWSIGTYLRLKPNYDPDLEIIQCDYHEMKDDEDNLRTMIELEIPDDADPGLVHNNSQTGRLQFEFDNVFGPMTTQDYIFEQVAKENVSNIFDGISGTIFAYGQTGSGKTFSTFGGNNFQERGIIPRSISLLFEHLKEMNIIKKCFQYKCSISFIEIYQENVYDLLEINRINQPLEMWSTVQLMESEDGMILRNLNVFNVTTEDEAIELFFHGHHSRITSSTAMNKASSRSHAIFTITLETEGIKLDQTTFTSAKLNLVDLAGSERMFKMENSRASIKEAKVINLSLHYLEQVIITLREHAETQKKLPIKSVRNNYVPYRNSILTSILRDSLGGNCKSSFLLCISVDKLHFEETIATCRFGQRCGEVKLQISANTEIGLSDQLKELTVKVKALEKQLIVLEEEKAALENELNIERELRLKQTEPRILTEQEKSNCKSSVQELLTAAKQSITLKNAEKERKLTDKKKKSKGKAKGGGLNSVMEIIEEGDGGEGKEEEKETAEDVIEQSHDQLFETVEKMDKAVLVELSTALGGLVQSMFMEREALKQQQLAETMKNQRAEQVAQMRIDEEQRNLEIIMNGDLHKIHQVDKIPQLLWDVLRKGTIFVKISRMGKRELRHYTITEDMQQLSWRPVATAKKSKGEHGIQYLRAFHSVEADPSDHEGCKMILKGHEGQQKNVLLECKDGESVADNRKLIREWIAGLRFLIEKAHR